MVEYLRALQRALADRPPSQGVAPLQPALPADCEAVSISAQLDQPASVDSPGGKAASGVGVFDPPSSAQAGDGHLGKAERAQLSVEDEWTQVLSLVAALCAGHGAGHLRGEEGEEVGRPAGRGKTAMAGRRGPLGVVEVSKGAINAAGKGTGDESQVLKMQFEIEALTKAVKQRDDELAAGWCTPG